MTPKTTPTNKANRPPMCIIIISHGRPDRVQTLQTLLNLGCTLPIYILIDNTDETAEQYFELYGERVHVFDKKYYAKLADNFDNFEKYTTSTHARNACFDLAAHLGFIYFLMLDDDYHRFNMRINSKLQPPNHLTKITKNIDAILLTLLDYYKRTGCTSLSISQGGDWLGGSAYQFYRELRRKAMNAFFCSTERRFWFVSRLNEDVNTYLTLGHQGHVFFPFQYVELVQPPTQVNPGGMTSAYLEYGTYLKSFYSVICRPDCVRIGLMGPKNRRIHHLTNWSTAVPKIIPEKFRKLKSDDNES